MEPGSSPTSLTPHEALSIIAPTYAREGWHWKHGQFGELSLQDLWDLGCYDTVWRHVAEYAWINLDRRRERNRNPWSSPDEVKSYVMEMVERVKKYGRVSCSLD